MALALKNNLVLIRLYRLLATGASAAGCLLLARVIYHAATGELARQLFEGQMPVSPITTLYALALSLPVPFHAIAIGFVMQKRWLPAPMARIAWAAIVISGIWLGLSLAVKTFLLS